MAELAAAIRVTAATAAMTYFSVLASQSAWKDSAMPSSGASKKLRPSNVALPTTGSAVIATTAMPV